MVRAFVSDWTTITFLDKRDAKREPISVRGGMGCDAWNDLIIANRLQLDRGCHNDQPVCIALIRPAGDQSQPFVLGRGDPLSIFETHFYSLPSFWKYLFYSDGICKFLIA